MYDKGMDMVCAAISQLTSPQLAKALADTVEYEPHTDSNYDPFADIHGTRDVLPGALPLLI